MVGVPHELTEELTCVGRPGSADHGPVRWKAGDVQELEAGPVGIDDRRMGWSAWATDGEKDLAPARRPDCLVSVIDGEFLRIAPVWIGDEDVRAGGVVLGEGDLPVRPGILRLCRSTDGQDRDCDDDREHSNPPPARCKCERGSCHQGMTTMSAHWSPQCNNENKAARYAELWRSTTSYASYSFLGPQASKRESPDSLTMMSRPGEYWSEKDPERGPASAKPAM